MASAKTWLWIILGFVGVCVLGLFAIAGAGVYFVSRHIQVKPTTSANALQTFDAARSRFKSQEPLIVMDEFERPRTTRRIAEMPTSAVKPTDLHVLVWNADENKLVNVSVPFWILRFGRQKMKLAGDGNGFNVERLNLDVPELERIGPSLVLDFRPQSGERVLIWTQ
jgi:hypothetical protein